MPRRPRIRLAGLPQHIIQRGINREPCFFAEEDYHGYLHWLQKSAADWHCAIHAYVLMANHVHPLVTPEIENGIAKLRQSVGRREERNAHEKYISKLTPLVPKAGIDNAAHFGGLFAGLLLGAGFVASAARKWLATAAAGILLAVGSARAVDAAQPVRDEMAFRAFIVAYAADESRINQAAQTLLSSARVMPPQEFVQRLDREVISGWQVQHKRISALTNLTSRNQQLRDYMLRFVKLKQQGFEVMRDGIRHDDKQLVLSSKEKFDQANDVLEEMKQWAEGKKDRR